MIFCRDAIITLEKGKHMQIKKLILIPLTIVLGIFLGYQSHKAEKEKNTQIYQERPSKTITYKDIRQLKFLSEQIINHKSDYQENRPKPKNKEEEIVAYYEDSIANNFERNPEVYEENATVYVNLDGHPKVIAYETPEYESMSMMPKLSASKKHVVYQLCAKEHDGCVVVVEEISTKKKTILKDASSYTWHPTRELLVYDGAQKDDGHVMLESDIFFYSPLENSIVELTNSSDFVEMHPVFSEDGDDIYCEDEKTGKLLYFNMFGNYRNTFIKKIKFYKTADSSLEIEAIKEKADDFKSIEKDEKFAEKNMSHWIELEFSKEMKAGIYFSHTLPYVFDKTSFTTEQLKIKENPKMIVPFSDAHNKYALVFNYDPKTDASRYYFHLDSHKVSPPFVRDFMKIEERNETQQVVQEQYRSYTYSQQHIKETILASMVIGMILMSALYSVVMFFRRRDKNGKRQKAFIYYTLMQISMALFLLTPYIYFKGLFNFDLIGMKELTLVLALFATLFTQAFLETKKHLPIIHTLLNVYLVLILADMIWIFDSILFQYKLYEIFALLFLLTAILRIKNGFKPAWFYLIGWIGLLVAIFLMDFFHMSNFLMYVGVFIEAVMLAWGLVFHAEGES